MAITDTPTSQSDIFTVAFDKKCPGVQPNSIRTFPQVKHADDLCSGNWINFRNFNNFSSEDFLFSAPNQIALDHISKSFIITTNKSYNYYNNNNNNHFIVRNSKFPLLVKKLPPAVKLKDEICYTNIKNAFVGPLGGVFDCERQYPLLLHRTGLFHVIIKRKPAPKQVISHDHLISLAFRANDFFSHVFSVGVSMAVWALPILDKFPSAKVLVPAGGPFRSLLQCIGVPPHRIATISGDEIHFATRLDLIIRKPPFNVLQAHWPGNALHTVQEKCFDWLRARHNTQDQNDNKNQSVSIDQENTSSLLPTDQSRWPFGPRNLVLYLWRPNGKRHVADQLELVSRIERSLRSDLQLQVIGRERELSSRRLQRGNRDQEERPWVLSSQYFARAVAVIGPHGGAFGNIFFVAPSTLVIEFSVPWRFGEWLDGRAPIRDLFYSTARGIGVTDYWFLVPDNAEEVPGRVFYEEKTMYIDPEAVLTVLRLRGFAIVLSFTGALLERHGTVIGDLASRVSQRLSTCFLRLLQYESRKVLGSVNIVCDATASSSSTVQAMLCSIVLYSAGLL